MNREIRDKWIARLTDGRLQGDGLLDYTMNGVRKQCCLGVLCEIAAEEGVVTRRVGGGDGDEIRPLVYVSPEHPRDGGEAYLPVVVQAWAGLDSADGSYGPYRGAIRASLAADNDTGKTFAEIAETIREHF